MPEHGEIRAALSNALVALIKERWGKGPTAAKSFLNDEYVLTVLEGGLMRNEETMLAAGLHDTIRIFRLQFQQAIRDDMCSTVERITGRKVLDYHSQVVFEPVRAFELFVLDGPVETEQS
ncbi:MAG TPA: Na-translocating system protein MpsC family protein [Solirubrobacteraceae bacterium]|nr:Na-translocating system protein MpsC family protein [Solirubrobacteraceae bacterium]